MQNQEFPPKFLIDKSKFLIIAKNISDGPITKSIKLKADNNKIG